MPAPETPTPPQAEAPVLYDLVEPEALGWVRVPAMERHGSRAYRLPTGNVMQFSPGAPTKLAVLRPDAF